MVLLFLLGDCLRGAQTITKDVEHTLGQANILKTYAVGGLRLRQHGKKPPIELSNNATA